jgi:large subunit ribosomal protein L28
MSRVCKVTGKKPLTGHNVSHSNRKTKMRQLPNLKKKRFFNEETGKWVTLRVSTSAIRTITKKGVAKVLADL